MIAFFKRLYRRLPVIRECRFIIGQLEDLQASRRSQETLLRLLQEEYVSRLLAGTRYAGPKSLNRHEFQVFSQNGEDGILAEIFRRIGVSSKSFVEIGAGDGLENNTTLLLVQNWSGYWVEANAQLIATVRRLFHRPIQQGRLKVAQAFVTAENVQSVQQELGVPEEADLLSLDADRNTYWIWAALPRLRARVVVVEYNASFPPPIDWKVEYDAARKWNESLYVGASLKAYELLGRERGYSLVACDLSGTNAVFVRDDVCEDKFEAPFTAEFHYEPPRYFLSRKSGHRPCFSDLDE